MSSKSRRAAGKEKWVSGKNYKFDTPVKITRNQRVKRQLSIPSPWVQKQEGRKTPMSKPKVSRAARKQSEKKLKTFLQQQAKSKKQKIISGKLKIKSPVLSLTPVDIKKQSHKPKAADSVKINNHESEILKNDFNLDEKHEISLNKSLLSNCTTLSGEVTTTSACSEKLDSLTLADKIATILNEHPKTRKGRHSQAGKDETQFTSAKKRKYHDYVSEVHTQGKLDVSSVSMNNGNHEYSDSTNSSEDLSTGMEPEEELPNDVKTVENTSEEKPKKSWCNIA